MLEALAKDSGPSEQHPLQEILEEIIEGLPDALGELYHLRFREGWSIRAIADHQGYEGHQIIQYKLEKLYREITKALAERNILIGRKTT